MKFATGWYAHLQVGLIGGYLLAVLLNLLWHLL
jgi:hypothetical protein